MPSPFEVPYAQVEANLDTFVDEVFGVLDSSFLTMPRGDGFVEYAAFESGYEALKRATGGFQNMNIEVVVATIQATPVCFIVLRTMVGFTGPELAYTTTKRLGIEVSQGAARTLERQIRLAPTKPLSARAGVTDTRLRAMIATACALLEEGAPPDEVGLIHRLDKADTKTGLPSIRAVAELGVPYAVLLYERFLGRPFAGHKDSVSDLVGDLLESAIEKQLSAAGISFRKTKRAQRVAGFDQAPDFIVPDEFAPKVVIEAKISEDDGTARDKVTRVQHLGALSMQGVAVNDPPKFEVIACIAGRGFKVRREDMKKLLIATRGKVFTLQTLDKLIDCTQLAGFRTRS